MAASQASTNAESSQISTWVKCREVFGNEVLMEGDALPFPFLSLALLALWGGFAGAGERADGMAGCGGGVG
jgi:hypothetical protein